MKNYIYIIIVGLFLVVSCKKTEYGPQYVGEQTTPSQNTFEKKRLFITNEGNFTWGNASLSVYYPDDKTIENNVFSSVNNQNLGDVAQSMYLYGNDLFIVVNNSSKIEIIDKDTYQKKQTITGFNSPRYMSVVGNTAFVTDLYQNAVYVVDLTTRQITQEIPVNGWTEHLMKINDSLLLVENKGENTILWLNVNSMQFVDTTLVSEQPAGMFVDKNDKLWVLCNGGINSVLPQLYKIDLATNSIENTFTFSSIGESPNSLFSPDRETFYYINTDVFKMSVYDTALPTTSVISANGKLFYSMYVDSATSEIYLSDAIDYVQQGTVLRYNSNYQLTDTFKTGIIPGSFLMDY